MPIEYRSITRHLDNGEKIEAPVGIWIIAILSVLEESLPAEKQGLINERVAKMLADQEAQKIIAPKIAMPRNYVIKADPGKYETNKD